MNLWYQYMALYQIEQYQHNSTVSGQGTYKHCCRIMVREKQRPPPGPGNGRQYQQKS